VKIESSATEPTTSKGMQSHPVRSGDAEHSESVA